MFTQRTAATLCLVLMAGCVDRSPPERVPLSSRAITDGCGVQSAVTEYYSSQRHMTVRPRVPRNWGEFWINYLEYDLDDPERYRVRDRNVYRDLLAFILAQDGYEVRGGCSSRIEFDTSARNLFSPDARTLCVSTTGDDFNQPPFITSRSCTDVASGRNTYDVIVGR